MPSQVEGIAALKGQLRRLARELAGRTAPAALRSGAETIAAEVRRGAPVETGRLRASVEVRPVADRPGRVAMDVEVAGGHDGPFVGSVEFGGPHRTPDPFIRTAFAARSDAVARDVAGAIGDGVDRLAGRG